MGRLHRTNPTPVELNRDRVAKLAEGKRLYDMLEDVDRKLEPVLYGHPILGLLPTSERAAFGEGMIPGHQALSHANEIIQANPNYQEYLKYMVSPLYRVRFKLKNPVR
jgi:hypothetical protein